MTKQISKKALEHLLKKMDNPVTKEAVLKHVNGNLKYALDPVSYAEGAIRTISDQISRTKSTRKLSILKSRLTDWEKRLEIFKQNDTIVTEAKETLEEESVNE